MIQSRLDTVLENMREMGIPQLLVTDPVSIYYLTGRGIEPGKRYLGLYLAMSGAHKIFLNKLFVVPEDLGVEKVWFSDSADSAQLVAGYTDHQPLGVDKMMQARFLLPLMERHAASGYVSASGCVDAARMIKDGEEIIRMRRASAINDEAMGRLIRHFRKGVTEKEMAETLAGIYKELGADGFSFEPIIAFAGNGAEGHHELDDTKLKEGDSIVVDIGCKKDGYCADMTRTFFYKTADPKYAQVFDIALRANEAAEAVVKPGARFCDLDRTARGMIEEAGYGPCFPHRLGHNIGLEVHEPGDVSSANANTVQPGMIFSIEPGIYLSGEMGVRIEDLVLVTETGCELLNHFPKTMTVLED